LTENWWKEASMRTTTVFAVVEAFLGAYEIEIRGKWSQTEDIYTGVELVLILRRGLCPNVQ
jgi:hypothetical protein